jgi:hypothetical protein
MAELNLNSLLHQLIYGNKHNIIRVYVALQQLLQEVNFPISLFVMGPYN